MQGVVTHSSGNHGQAVALAAQLRGIPAHVVLPTDTPQCKVDAVEGYGGAPPSCILPPGIIGSLPLPRAGLHFE